jgi:regulator of ribosome biosynthesis
LTLFSVFKFEPTEKSVEAEKNANLALIRKLGDSSSKKIKRGRADDDGGGGDGKNILNVRKAVRFASREEGAMALARKSAPRADSRQNRKGKR